MFNPKIPKSDTGFEISVKIYPGIRTPYAYLSLFSAGTAICEISNFSKSGGLAFLTTSLDSEISKYLLPHTPLLCITVSPQNLLAALGREQLVVWEGFSDVFRAVGLGVGAIWTLDFLGDRKKNQLFLGWAGVS